VQNIEKSTIPRVPSSLVVGFQLTKSSPMRGVLTMLPALTPTQTVSSSDGRRSVNPHHRRPPAGRRPRGPKGPSAPHRCWAGGELEDSQRLPAQVAHGCRGRPVIERQAEAGVHMGCPYSAVGMQRAVESAIGLPRTSTSALWMLGFLTPLK